MSSWDDQKKKEERLTYAVEYPTHTDPGCSDYLFTYVEDFRQGFSLSKLQVSLVYITNY